MIIAPLVLRRRRVPLALVLPLAALALATLSGCGGSDRSFHGSVRIGDVASPTASGPTAAAAARPATTGGPSAPATSFASPPASAPRSGHASGPASTQPSAGTCVTRRQEVLVHVLSAEVGSNHRVQVRGPLQTLVCGGPDDGHFDDGAVTVVLTVTPTARVVVLPFGTAGPQQRSIRPQALPSYVAAHRSSDVFAVSGSAGAVSALVEQYRP